MDTPPTTKDSVRPHTYSNTPPSKARGHLALSAQHCCQSLGAVPSCPARPWGHQGGCPRPTGALGQRVKQGSWERHGEPFRKTLPVLLLPKDFLRGFAFIPFSLSCKLTLFQPSLCPVCPCPCGEAASGTRNCLISSSPPCPLNAWPFQAFEGASETYLCLYGDRLILGSAVLSMLSALQAISTSSQDA